MTWGGRQRSPLICIQVWSAGHESIQRLLMCTCILAVMVKWGAYLRSRPWFCQMFSIILMICSVSMSCLRSAEAERDKEVDDSKVIISCLAALWSTPWCIMEQRCQSQFCHRWCSEMHKQLRYSVIQMIVTCSFWIPCKEHRWGCVSVLYVLQV